MNKTALKNFAMWSRRKLIEQVQTKAFLYGIDEKNGLLMEEQFGQLVINGQTYPLSMKSSFTALQKQLEQKGYKQLLEEVAYTWFNRIIAIRYMEVHEYLPEKVNVLSSNVGRVDPDILFEFDTMDLAIDEAKVRELVNAGDTEAAFRLLFVAQCNALNTILPFMFEKIQDYTELLLPDFLLDAESVIKTLVQIQELTESFGEIEVIGWLYQYYIAEEKDRVFAQKSKYKKEEIPFATQLFTPKWIVQYMVQNSLGRYWTEAHREDEDLIDKWEYFITHEEEDFHEKIAPYVNKELKVEDIKLLDPAMGSGHILVYAFEVFHEIYEKCGYPEREIPRLILENNLYGLDIDDRAYQLASFAVVMKAASYSKRFLRSVEREGIQLNLASIQETNHISDDVIAYIAQQEVGDRYNQVKAFFDQYHNAKTYGSLINITEREISFIEERLVQIANNPVHDLFYGEQHEIAKQVLPILIHQTKIMRNAYDVVVMNPPYMGNGSMSKELGDYLKKYYPSSKTDLFAAFMEIDHYKHALSYLTCINQHSWMFLSNFDKLRKKVLNHFTIDSLVHLGTRAFEEISGEVVQSVVFVLRNSLLQNFNTKYIRLIDYPEANLKRESFKIIVQEKNENFYSVAQDIYLKVPGNTIAYWIDILDELFGNQSYLMEKFEVRNGITTGENEKFIRYWFEVDNSNNRKWYPCNKGGEFRRWYGNHFFVIDWENDGYRLKNFKDDKGKNRATLRSIEFNFQEAITMSRITTSGTSFRFLNSGFVTEGAANNIYFNGNSKDEVYMLMGFLNSKIADFILDIYNPTINIMPDNLRNIPYIELNNKNIIDLVKENIDISKVEWNFYEISREFEKPLLLNFDNQLLEESAYKSVQFKKQNIEQLKKNEELINEFFIGQYKLEKYLDPNVDNGKVTIYRTTSIEDAKNLLSYFIGCCFGRFELNDFSAKNMLVFTEKNYLQNDVIENLKVFLSNVFSTNTIEENIIWLAEALELKQNEDAETRIRRYFMDEFFTDHCKMYQKRPIYWLVDSGKQKGLRTLIYMHRYQPDTMATIRFEHLQEIQAKYQQEISDLENRLVNPNLSAADKKKLNAEKVSFEKKIDELREFDKRLAAIAAEEIEIDLDDGVKVNYEKFYRGRKGVLAKIK